jgi:hypothetical protein
MKLVDNKSSDEVTLSHLHGPLLGGVNLIQILGFKTGAAFRRADKKNLLGVKTFSISGRRGKFAYTKDVEIWLSNLSVKSKSHDSDLEKTE